jgi:hypothetical protein
MCSILWCIAATDPCHSNSSTKHFTVPSSESIARYLQTWTKFTFALLTSTNSDKTPYRFPFTPFELAAVQRMQTSLQATSPPTTQHEARRRFISNLAHGFHIFIRTFLFTREGPLNPPPPNATKFDSVLECLQAVSAIRPGGILCRPDDLTPTCTHIKYWIRMCILFEADQRVKSTPGLQLPE